MTLFAPRIAVSMATFGPLESRLGRAARPLDIEGPFSLASELGLDGVEAVPKWIRANSRAVEGYVASSGIPIVGGYYWGSSLTEFSEASRVLKDFGGDYITSIVTLRSLAEAIQLVRAQAQVAQELGLRYQVETHRRSITERPADACVLASAIPDLKFTADYAHWISLGIDPRTEAWLLGRVGHVQVRVASEYSQQIEVADGESPELQAYWELALVPVLQAGYNGIIVTELLGGEYLNNQRYDPVDDTRCLVRWLRSRPYPKISAQQS